MPGCLGQEGQQCDDQDALVGWAQDGLDLYCYFNNDYHGYALDNAAQLKDLVGEKG